jgi:hypothetical protein
MMVVMLRLGGCNRGTAKNEQAENDNRSSEKTLYTIHVHGLISSLLIFGFARNFHFQIPDLLPVEAEAVFIHKSTAINYRTVYRVFPLQLAEKLDFGFDFGWRSGSPLR